MTATLQISNLGSRNSPSSYVEIYGPDVRNYQRIFVGELKTGWNKFLRIDYPLPSGQTASGEYVMAVIDPDDTIVETNEKNNVVIYGPIP